MNTHIFLVSVSLVLILIFMHDLKSVEIKIMGNDYPNVENLQKQYNVNVTKPKRRTSLRYNIKRFK